MKFRHSYWLLLLLVPALLACNLSTLVSESSPAAPAGNTVSQKTNGTQAAPLQKLEVQARDVVSAFLTSLKNDPSGKQSTGFLSQKLLDQVNAGKTIDQLLGGQGMIPAYQLSAVSFSPDTSMASIDASLMYQKPANYRFGLVRSGDTWKVDSILNMDSGDAYPPTPEGVVENFLQSYQEAPNQMEQYISPATLAQPQPGGAVGMLNINGSLEGMMIESAVVNPNPPSAVVTVAMRVGGKDVTRTFLLSKNNEQWKIDSIQFK